MRKNLVPSTISLSVVVLLFVASTSASCKFTIASTASWAEDFSAALAAVSGFGDVICFSAGDYYGDQTNNTWDVTGFATYANTSINFNGAVINCNSSRRFMYADNPVNISNGEVSGCYADDDGGAFVFNQVADVTHMKFVDNYAVNGGAIRHFNTMYVTDSSFYANSAQTNGGAIDAQGKLYARSVVFGDNWVGQYGAGVQAKYATEFVDVLAENNTAYYGGFLYSYLSDDVTFNRVSCNYNAASYGGCFVAYAANDVNITHSEFTGNNAYSAGAAAWVDNDDSVVWSHCVIKGNTAGVSASAVYAQTPSEYYYTTFSDNTASQGTLRVVEPATIVGCVFDSNTATTRGAAINAEATITVSNITVTNNNQKAVYVSPSVAGLSNFSNVYASGNYIAFSLEGLSDYVISDSLIENNVADSVYTGSAIYAVANTFETKRTCIRNNTNGYDDRAVYASTNNKWNWSNSTTLRCDQYFSFEGVINILSDVDYCNGIPSTCPPPPTYTSSSSSSSSGSTSGSTAGSTTASTTGGPSSTNYTGSATTSQSTSSGSLSGSATSSGSTTASSSAATTTTATATTTATTVTTTTASAAATTTSMSTTTSSAASGTLATSTSEPATPTTTLEDPENTSGSSGRVAATWVVSVVGCVAATALL